MGRSWSGDSFKRKGYNGAGHWTGPHSGSSPIACHLQEIFVVSHVYKCMFIYVPYNTNRSHCARTGCYICISTPHGAPIWTTYIGQIVVGCIQFTMPHRSGLESYVNTNKNHFVFHSIQSETWCIQNWFQGGVPFIRNQSVLLWVPVLGGSRWQRIWLNLQSGSQNSSCFFGRFSLFLTVDWCWLWLELAMTNKISDDNQN